MKKTYPNSSNIQDITEFLGIGKMVNNKEIKFVNDHTQFQPTHDPDFSAMTMAEILKELDIDVDKKFIPHLDSYDELRDRNNRKWIAIGMMLGAMNYRMHPYLSNLEDMF